MSHKRNLKIGGVGPKLAGLALPMLIGIFSIVAFNLADTFFVSRLGTEALAAMSFTFPVVTLIGALAMGLGIAASSVVSRAIGSGKRDQARYLTTHSLLLSILIVVTIIILGLVTMETAFGLLGAAGSVFVLIRKYMTIWYFGVVFVIVPMVGNNAIRATGDAKYPAMIMVFSALLNVVIDPILIFGLFGFPRMELAGAALATVVARTVSFLFSLGILYFRENLLDFSHLSLSRLLESWRIFMYTAAPAVLSQILLPLSLAAITRIASGFGPALVAALGVGTRISYFAFIPIMALGSALIPFVGQNWGGGELLRVGAAQDMSNRFSLWWGCGVAFVFALAAPFIASLFSENRVVTHNIVLYLRLVPWGYGLLGICRLSEAVFNAVNRPIWAALVGISRILVFYVPLAWVGSVLLEETGFFAGLALANVLGGMVALIFVLKAREKSFNLVRVPVE